ncbi:hypothetical protein PENTCL1PPCAC_25541 [Pristionchus entomophagus]|uniref:G protein-coupled receptor n=1 Tax=Pristionchus entomophagus TaxID=358040 RepID=A0AAV5U9A4_9BILA|nr:hypothetical protein PENTCL1PPCAC_25541 [Pristionchus entomophagus]
MVGIILTKNDGNDYRMWKIKENNVRGRGNAEGGGNKSIPGGLRYIRSGQLSCSGLELESIGQELDQTESDEIEGTSESDDSLLPPSLSDHDVHLAVAVAVDAFDGSSRRRDRAARRMTTICHARLLTASSSLPSSSRFRGRRLASLLVPLFLLAVVVAVRVGSGLIQPALTALQERLLSGWSGRLGRIEQLQRALRLRRTTSGSGCGRGGGRTVALLYLVVIVFGLLGVRVRLIRRQISRRVAARPLCALGRIGGSAPARLLLLLILLAFLQLCANLDGEGLLIFGETRLRRREHGLGLPCIELGPVSEPFDLENDLTIGGPVVSEDPLYLVHLVFLNILFLLTLLSLIGLLFLLLLLRSASRLPSPLRRSLFSTLLRARVGNSLSLSELLLRSGLLGGGGIVDIRFTQSRCLGSVRLLRIDRRSHSVCVDSGEGDALFLSTIILIVIVAVLVGDAALHDLRSRLGCLATELDAKLHLRKAGDSGAGGEGGRS